MKPVRLAILAYPMLAGWVAATREPSATSEVELLVSPELDDADGFVSMSDDADTRSFFNMIDPLVACRNNTTWLVHETMKHDAVGLEASSSSFDSNPGTIPLRATFAGVGFMVQRVGLDDPFLKF